MNFWTPIAEIDDGQGNPIRVDTTPDGRLRLLQDRSRIFLTETEGARLVEVLSARA